MRSFDGRKQEQDDLHTGGIIKGLGMKSHLHSPKSNSKQQVCINNATFSPASGKKTLQAQELRPKKTRGTSTSCFALYPQHMYFSM